MVVRSLIIGQQPEDFLSSRQRLNAKRMLKFSTTLHRLKLSGTPAFLKLFWRHRNEN
ncbi:hypothetical protein Ab1vBOLIVR5_gp98c [Agrobacterium phage OLIVR5]|uniref:Uncharacterized protein n=1 Tax=Agrobacterium phage OLIVR5 TaxID=2723773 RepID=A0A858MSQ1_9CAUD|nr:hypothetical protein KNU99_gp098 [Agrobacterium phage OLIVR5]QIW87746.1 hypothetical protein Ab1vBOLIVR5_gp98c [Agrobacterium phage OLIVR5]QIW88008.1 hypothetical protein Ab1vBOLIVR6_gp101c [Agrobacterium phage OLIVR6]